MRFFLRRQPVRLPRTGSNPGMGSISWRGECDHHQSLSPLQSEQDREPVSVGEEAESAGMLTSAGRQTESMPQAARELLATEKQLTSRRDWQKERDAQRWLWLMRLPPLRAFVRGPEPRRAEGEGPIHPSRPG